MKYLRANVTELTGLRKKPAKPIQKPNVTKMRLSQMIFSKPDTVFSCPTMCGGYL